MIKKALFILESSVVPLFRDRATPPMPYLLVVCLTLSFLLLVMCCSFVGASIKSPEAVALDSAAVNSQMESTAEITSLPTTEPIEEPLSFSLFFSILVGCVFYVVQVLSENLFLILVPLIPFYFLERRFRVRLVIPASFGVGLFFTWLHASWGFSVLGLASFVPFAVLMAYLTYQHGVVKAFVAHLVYNFTIILVSIVSVFSLVP